jgi:ElaB/YqjD/DUF883 family membrane-anchored ribosome-binding protein
VTTKDFTSAADAAASRMDEAKSRIQEGASELGQRAAEFGRAAVDALDARRGTAASGLDSAASSLDANANKLPPRVGAVARQAAETLGAGADYVRDNSVRDAVTDLQGYVKAHPTQALIGAVVLGFLAGRMLTRD